MLTVVLEANLAAVELALAVFTSPPLQFQVVGRLTAVQSPIFERMGEQKIRNFADALGLPVRAIVDRPPFDAEDDGPPQRYTITVDRRRRALPPDRG